MAKFSITSSTLFTNQNKSEVPSWMKNLEDFVQEEKPVQDFGFSDNVAAFQKEKVQRDDRNYNSREMVASYNNDQITVAAKIELAKFLNGKYYTTESKVIGDKVSLKTRITNVAGLFNFPYIKSKGKVKNAQVFTVTTSDEKQAEYPFSKAGLEECISDIKLGRIKTAEKAKNYTASMITLSEIVRRYNGDTRQAMDRARELVKAGEIIGVNSNTFATVYNIDELFPQQEKTLFKEAKNLELVKNIEHTAANEHKSAKKLAIEASKLLNNFFDDFSIQDTHRDKNELLVKANVLLNGLQKSIDFNFGIKNEHIASLKVCEADNKRFTIEQLLDSIGKTNLLTEYEQTHGKNAKKLYHGIILTAKDIHDKLRKVVSKQTINDIIDNWQERNLIKPINTTTFVTTASFKNLLNEVYVPTLSDEEQDRLQKYASFISAQEIDRQDILDTGKREDIPFTRSIRITAVNNALHALNPNIKFTIEYASEDATKLNVSAISAEGKQNLTIFAKYRGNVIDTVSFNSNLEKSAALKLYDEKHKHNVFAKAMFSEYALKETLREIFCEDKIQKLASFIETKCVHLGNNVYASEVPLSYIVNQLEKKTMISSMSKEEKLKWLKNKKKVEADLERQEVQDSDTREVEFTRATRLANAQKVLHQMTNKPVKQIAASKDAKNIKVAIQTATGNQEVNINVSYHGNDVLEVEPIILKSTLADKLHKNAVFAKGLFTREKLYNTLMTIFNENKVEKLTEFALNKFAKKVGNFYASEVPVTYIVNELTKITKSMTEKEKLAWLRKGKKVEANIEREFVEDNDTRVDIPFNRERRLANIYKTLPFTDNYKIVNMNKDATELTVNVTNALGTYPVYVKLDYDLVDKNRIVEVTMEGEQETSNAYNLFEMSYSNSNEFAPSMFSDSRLEDALLTAFDETFIPEIKANITSKLSKVGSLYMSKKPLTAILAEVEKNYPVLSMSDKKQILAAKKYFNQQTFYKDNVQDTENRQLIIPIRDEQKLQFANQYLANHFASFKGKKYSSKGDNLEYTVSLFDNNSGLVNDVTFNLHFNGNHIDDCKVKLYDKYASLKNVRKVFATNSILRAYLNKNKSHHESPIICSIPHFKEQLKTISNASDEDIQKAINAWSKQNKIQKFGSNCFVSKYTLSQLLSMSNLQSRTLEESKEYCKKLIHNKLMKMSKIAMKDNDTRQVEYDSQKLTQMIITGISRKYKNFILKDINLGDKLIVTASVMDNGVHSTRKFTFNLFNGKVNSMNEETHKQTLGEKFAKNEKQIKAERILISKDKLQQRLIQLVNIDLIDDVMMKLTTSGLLKNASADMYASKYSLAEIIDALDKYGYIDKEAGKQQVLTANRQISVSKNSKEYDDISRNIKKKEQKLEGKLIFAQKKLVKQVISAKNKHKLTSRKAEELLSILNKATKYEELESVYRILSDYLK